MLLDTGDALVFDGVDPETETVDNYIEGFKTKALSVSFQTSADEWTVIPAHRIVAIRARPERSEQR